MLRRIVQLAPLELEDRDAPSTSVLGAVTTTVTEFSEELENLVLDLIDTLFAHPVAVGLASTQIGESARVAVVNVQRQAMADTLVLVNPTIQTSSGKKDTKRESCMSLPHYAGGVERRTKVFVAYQDQFGGKHTQSFEAFMARVVQHEIDHLDGHLYTRHLRDIAALEATDIFDYPDPFDTGRY